MISHDEPKTAQVFQRPMQQRFHCGDTQIIMCSGFRQAYFAQMDMLHNGSLAGGELAQQPASSSRLSRFWDLLMLPVPAASLRDLPLLIAAATAQRINGPRRNNRHQPGQKG
jgi:hypothetical protein